MRPKEAANNKRKRKKRHRHLELTLEQLEHSGQPNMVNYVLTISLDIIKVKLKQGKTIRMLQGGSS